MIFSRLSIFISFNSKSLSLSPTFCSETKARSNNARLSASNSSILPICYYNCWVALLICLLIWATSSDILPHASFNRSYSFLGTESWSSCLSCSWFCWKCVKFKSKSLWVFCRLTCFDSTASLALSISSLSYSRRCIKSFYWLTVSNTGSKDTRFGIRILFKFEARLLDFDTTWIMLLSPRASIDITLSNLLCFIF